MAEMTPARIYTDGGVHLRNPSPVGGAWAYVWVNAHGESVLERSGAVVAADLDVEAVTNNHTELLAAVFALQSVPADWGGVLCTDSEVTASRLKYARTFNNVPAWLAYATRQLSAHRNWTVELVKGHPTKALLRAGRAATQDGREAEVSLHNVRCDELCKRAMCVFGG